MYCFYGLELDTGVLREKKGGNRRERCEKGVGKCKIKPTNVLLNMLLLLGLIIRLSKIVYTATFNVVLSRSSIRCWFLSQFLCVSF